MLHSDFKIAFIYSLIQPPSIEYLLYVKHKTFSWEEKKQVGALIRLTSREGDRQYNKLVPFL